jgi:hypothetical protein
VEAISVIVRTDVLHEKFPGGWVAFRTGVPNRTLCSDDEIARVGFMTPADAEAYANDLSAYDIRYVVNGMARDLVVVDQLRGPMVVCDWIEFGHINLHGDPNRRVAACRKKGSQVKQVILPPDWKFESSLTATYGFVPTKHVDCSLRFLRQQDGLDVYLNELTGEEVFLGRTSGTAR